MANICENTLFFISTNAEPIKKLHSLFHVNRHESLASLLMSAGIAEREAIFDGAYRNELYQVNTLKEDNGNYYFTAFSTSAWIACVGALERFLQKYYPSIDFYYESIEPGCEYYVNTDVERLYLTNEVYVDIHYKGCYETFCASSVEDVVDYLGSLVPELTLKKLYTYSDIERELLTLINEDKDEFLTVLVASSN